jgi:hypothetical protein
VLVLRKPFACDAHTRTHTRTRTSWAHTHAHTQSRVVLVCTPLVFAAPAPAWHSLHVHAAPAAAHLSCHRPCPRPPFAHPPQKVTSVRLSFAKLSASGLGALAIPLWINSNRSTDDLLFTTQTVEELIWGYVRGRRPAWSVAPCVPLSRGGGSVLCHHFPPPPPTHTHSSWQRALPPSRARAQLWEGWCCRLWVQHDGLIDALVDDAEALAAKLNITIPDIPASFVDGVPGA